MENKICVLFDMDGVMIDTEPQYDNIWRYIAGKYNIDIPDFEKIIKGTTLPNILKKYFSHLSEDELKDIERILDEFEADMNFPEIAGALKFLDELKLENIKVGLVTSSTQTKLKSVNKVRHFNLLFDTIVSAERVLHGKPNPECYLLAAEDLGVLPQNCVVFEDSLAGIEAGKSAGMTVIALSTTYPAELLDNRADIVIPDFGNFSVDELYRICHA